MPKISFLNKFAIFSLILMNTFSFYFICLATEEPPINFSETVPSTISLWTEKSPLVQAVNWFFNIVIILCVIMIIYAGFTYVTSGGDPGKTKKALQTLIYALIGIAIALLAKGLIKLIGVFIGAGDINLPAGL